MFEGVLNLLLKVFFFRNYSSKYFLLLTTIGTATVFIETVLPNFFIQGKFLPKAIHSKAN